MNENKLKVYIEESWEEVRQKLYNKEIKYCDINGLKQLNFFDRFDNMFKTSGEFAVVELAEIDMLLRSCKDEQTDKNRFKALKKCDGKKWEENKHRLGTNRYNEPERGFMYFGIGMKDNIKSYDYVKETCAKEIRVFNNNKIEYISTLRFKVIDKYKDKKVLDFSKIGSYNYCDDIVNEVLKLNVKIEKEKIKTGILTKKMSQQKRKNIEDMAVKIYLKLVNDSTFKEINKSTLSDVEIEREYAPFHAFANYIEHMGYSGIIYNSTVHKNGLNLVLFDRDIVEFCGEIEVEKNI